MKIIDVTQGTPEWHAVRAEYFTASEAPAMMGVSKYQSRSDLLLQKKTGLAPEVDAATQRLFDNGHATEAAARPIVERMIGEDLYPVVGARGNLLASLDGIDMLETVVFEHKALNQSLIQQIAAGELEAHYWAQLEQQLYVSGAERAIFVCSDGTEENLHWLEYRPVPGRIEQILAGWKQFEEDLAAFEPQAPAQKVAANQVDDLPSVMVQVTGSVAIVDNLAVFEVALGDFLANRLIREPRTDQDFADLDLQIKALKKAESALDAAEAQMLAQVQTVDAIKRKKDAMSKLIRDNRLLAEKLLASEKEARRLEIKTAAESAFAAHVAAINKRLGKVQLPPIRADFAGVMKGKRTIATLQDAADTELARLKIEANASAEAIEVNLASLRTLATDHAFLFSDAQQLVLKDNEALEAIIKSRIADHEAEEKAKAEARAEAERERIREEERAALAKEQAAKEQAERERIAAEQRERDAAERQRLEKERAEKAAERESLAAEASPQPVAELSDTAFVAEMAKPLNLQPAATAALQPVDDGQRINLGDINARLGFSLSADFLRSIGIESVGRERAAVLYRASDFARICAALVAHIGRLGQRAAA